MGKNISTVTRKELLKALRSRYHDSTKKGKMQILNKFVAVSGYHRKHAIRLFSIRVNGVEKRSMKNGVRACHGRKIYDEAVKEALILTWEAADRICGKRLKAILPDFVDAMERHGHLDLDTEIRKRLLSASASTIDRLLAPVRSQAKPPIKRRKSSKVNRKIPVRTFADWNDPDPGFLEIDFVVHCGGSRAGTYIHTLAVTDVCSGWTDCLPLLAREQSLVVEGLEALFQQIPFPVLGIDSDNDSAFINDTLLSFCKENQIEFTRSRAYRKNDQAWIEQINGAVVRRLVGHERFSGFVAGQALASLYQTARLYTNYFQASFKLRSKERNGSKVKRTYYRPSTPCDRIIKHTAIAE